MVGSDAIGVAVDRSNESPSIIVPSTGVPAGLPAIVQVGGVGCGVVNSNLIER